MCPDSSIEIGYYIFALSVFPVLRVFTAIVVIRLMKNF